MKKRRINKTRKKFIKSKCNGNTITKSKEIIINFFKIFQEIYQMSMLNYWKILWQFLFNITMIILFLNLFIQLRDEERKKREEKKKKRRRQKKKKLKKIEKRRKTRRRRKNRWKIYIKKIEYKNRRWQTINIKKFKKEIIWIR